MRRMNLPEGWVFRQTDEHPVFEGVDPVAEAPRGQPISDYWIERLAEFYGVSQNNVCCICGGKIEMQIFKNTSVCSELCRKDRDHDWQPFRGGALAP